MQEVSPNTSEKQVIWTGSVDTVSIFEEDLNADCKSRIDGISVHSKTWLNFYSAVGTTYLNTSNHTALASLYGSKFFGCEALSISAKPIGDVDALCDDTISVDPIRIGGALRMGQSTGDRVLVTPHFDVCRGVQINVGAQNPESSTCLDTRCLSTNTGQIAAFRFRESILTWVSESQSISKDGGQSWQ